MRRLLLLAAVSAIALARPELYKEKEDFQYSRSSSDDGTKSGYYGAQRGNMGRNYEKAHNMDGVAQRTMSSAVNNVQGELGDASRQRIGEVHTSGDTRGTYGDGYYDLSNLRGRNFKEGVTHDSHSSLSSMNTAHSGYSGGSSSFNSQNSKYTGQRLVGAYIQPAGYENNFGSHAEQSKYDANSEYNYNRASSSGQSANYYGSRLVGAAPARVIIRPGTVVAVPVAAETYDRNVASAYDQNAITSDTEVIANHHVVPVPTTKSKSYESSYRYSKEWEKHDTSPGAVPLAIPTVTYPQNSELYEDLRNEGHEHRMNEQRSSHNSASSQSKYQSGYNQQQTKSSGVGVYSGSQFEDMAEANNDALGRITILSEKPKSYQSSYSYHKSWERQGDPYVIKPAQVVPYDNQAPQRLTSDSTQSHRYGTKSSHASYSKTAVDCDCDEEGHVRQRRSYNLQQTQNEMANLEDMGQQTQDLGQQTQNGWANIEDLGQQTQTKRENLEDLGQQTQTKWDNLEDVGQQTQDLGQQTQDFGQITQDFGQQTQDLGQNQWDDLSNFRQHQTRNKFDKPTDLRQHTQGKEQDNMHVSLDKPNNKQMNDKAINSNLDHFNQQLNNKQDQADNQMISNTEQISEDFGQETQNVWGNLELLDQHDSQHRSNKHDESIALDNTQQIQSNWGHFSQLDDQLTQLSENAWHNEDKLKPNSNTNGDHIIPVWEDTSDTQQNTGQSNGAQHSIFTEHRDSNYSNSRTTSIPRDSSERGVSLKQLWDKIDSISQQSSTNTDSDQNPSWYTHYNNQGFQHSYWKQRDEEFNNNFNTRNHTGSSYSGLNQENQENNKKEDESFSGIFRESDIGRGDIGVEDTMKTATEKESKHISSSTVAPKDLSDISYKPKIKTPGEIEALSQTKEANKSTNHKADISDGMVVIGLNKQLIDDKKQQSIERNINTHSDKTENIYNNGQRVTNDFQTMQHNYNRNNGHEYDTQQATNSQRPEFPTVQQNTDHKSEVIPEDLNLEQQSQTSLDENFEQQSMQHSYNGNKYGTQKETINQRPEFPPVQQNTDQKSEVIPDGLNLEQQSQTSLGENFEQQSFLTHELNDFSGRRDDFYERRYSPANAGHKTNHNSGMPMSENQHINRDDSHKIVVPVSQEIVKQSVVQQPDFGQETMNLDQQSQSMFVENLEDMGQVQQQHADITQQIAEFDSINKNNDFYEQKYHYMPQERSAQVLSSPNNQLPKSQVEIVTPPEIITEKPGFWKSVGNKFVGAKDTVKSWFTSSE